jgi:hypothetical protein
VPSPAPSITVADAALGSTVTRSGLLSEFKSPNPMNVTSVELKPDLFAALNVPSLFPKNTSTNSRMCWLGDAVFGYRQIQLAVTVAIAQCNRLEIQAYGRLVPHGHSEGSVSVT